MKRALSVTAVTALSLLVFLFVGYGQEEGARAVSELLEEELAAMEATFGGLQALMGELIGEIKGNMGDIDELDARIEDYKDIVTAISVELKEAEGKIVGLRADVDALAKTQQELMVRVVALEAGLSELSAFVDELAGLLDLNIADLAALRSEFNVLADAFAEHVLDYEAFKVAIYGDLNALQVAVYGDIDALRDSIYADLAALSDNVGADLSMLKGQVGDLAARILALEEEDVGTFKKKVIDLERALAALAIRVDNNRAKLEGFDHAIAGLAEQIDIEVRGLASSRDAEMDSLQQRVLALEENTDIQSQLDTLFFISIVALLAGVGALIWGFLGNQ